jgi:flagellar basal body-associated protein FliL
MNSQYPKNKTIILITIISLLVIFIAAAYLLMAKKDVLPSKNDNSKINNIDEVKSTESVTANITTTNHNTAVKVEPIAELRTPTIATSSAEAVKPENLDAPSSGTELRESETNNKPRQHN